MPLPRQAFFERFPDIAPSTLTEWVNNKQRFELAVQLGYGGFRKLVTEPRVAFPVQETKLYLDFLVRRKYKGRKTTEKWLRKRMNKLMFADKPPNWEYFEGSNGWMDGFKKRHRIGSYSETNKKDVSVQEKLPKIQTFHRSWKHRVINFPFSQHSPHHSSLSKPSITIEHQHALMFRPTGQSTIHLRLHYCDHTRLSSPEANSSISSLISNVPLTSLITHHSSLF